jgi:hypothetical protein
MHPCEKIFNYNFAIIQIVVFTKQKDTSIGTLQFATNKYDFLETKNRKFQQQVFVLETVHVERAIIHW